MKIISWNIGHRPELWHHVANLKADVVLLQEAGEPPATLLSQLSVEAAPWLTDGPERRAWRTSIVALHPSIVLERIPTVPLCEAGPARLGVSRQGSLAAARFLETSSSSPLTLVSMYAAWERPLRNAKDSWIFADASAHRLVSDISALFVRQFGHRIIAAGDLNVLFGHGENGSGYWAARYSSIFHRLSALGLELVGPQFPHGRQAAPWPAELPADSRNVPTYRTAQQTPATATRQLDFVFASRDLVPRISVRALNDPAEWGPSDHCQIEITLTDA